MVAAKIGPYANKYCSTQCLWTYRVQLGVLFAAAAIRNHGHIAFGLDGQAEEPLAVKGDTATEDCTQHSTL